MNVRSFVVTPSLIKAKSTFHIASGATLSDISYHHETELSPLIMERYSSHGCAILGFGDFSYSRLTLVKLGRISFARAS